MNLISILLLSISSFGFSSSPSYQSLSQDPAVVERVDFNRYMGLWYQIAHAPNFFQRDCLRSTAEYALLENGEVSVHNICYKKNGKISDIKGTAKVVDPTVPAKLVVDFNIFAKGDYWIIDLDPDYQWAVVSGPKKKSLFILSRKAPMDSVLLEQIVRKLQSQGFEVSEFIYDQY